VSEMLRVMVHDAWDTVELPWRADQSIAQVKAAALGQTRVMGPPVDYLVKLRGATLRDEALTVAAAGVPPGGSVIVLHRQRRPVR
jgi:hypothetical protein